MQRIVLFLFLLMNALGDSLKSFESFKQTGGRGAFNSRNSAPSTRSDYITIQLDTTCHSKTEHFGKASIPKIIS